MLVNIFSKLITGSTVGHDEHIYKESCCQYALVHQWGEAVYAFADIPTIRDTECKITRMKKMS